MMSKMSFKRFLLVILAVIYVCNATNSARPCPTSPDPWPACEQSGSLTAGGGGRFSCYQCFADGARIRGKLAPAMGGLETKEYLTTTRCNVGDDNDGYVWIALGQTPLPAVMQRANGGGSGNMAGQLYEWKDIFVVSHVREVDPHGGADLLPNIFRDNPCVGADLRTATPIFGVCAYQIDCYATETALAAPAAGIVGGGTRTRAGGAAHARALPVAHARREYRNTLHHGHGYGSRTAHQEYRNAADGVGRAHRYDNQLLNMYHELLKLEEDIDEMEQR